jgi:hypothetical protein
LNRWLTSTILAVALAAAGCATKPSPAQDPPPPSAAPPGLQQMTPQQFTEFQPVINRYFHYRKQAVVTQDIAPLWQQYPALKDGADPQKAVNAESDVITRYRTLKLIDGNIQPEQYARFKAKVDGDQAVILVNGTELYLTDTYQESGGQLQILLYLQRQGTSWTVAKTDETTLAEYHQALK